jgi:hypothetical protein
MAAVLLTMVNAAAGGWMGPGRTSMTAVRVPLRMVTTWSRRGGGEPNHHNAPHTAPCCRLRTPPPPPPLCPPAGSIQNQVGVGGRSGVHRRRGGSRPSVTNNQKQKKKRRGTTAPHPPPQDRSPLPGHPSRAVPPYVYIYPWCQGAHPGTGSRPGPLAPAGGDPPQTSLQNHAESAAN